MRIVIIGNSTAAVGAVEGIRAAERSNAFDAEKQAKAGGGSSAEITIIAGEREHTYSRPLISYLLEGKTDEERMKYRPNDFYTINNVKTMLGRTVASVDPKAKTVTLEDGSTVPYDKLLLAAGSRPFIPPIAGLGAASDGAEYHTFQSLADAKKLEAALTEQSRVLIIGAGLIGLKCAEGIGRHLKEDALNGDSAEISLLGNKALSENRAASITIAEFAPRVLPSILDEDSAAIVQSHLEKQGLVFHLGNAVSSVDGHSAVLADGTRVDYDILVVASGVKPNIELLTEIGAKSGRAIITDPCGRSSLPDIFAAGDCAESLDVTDGESRVLAILPNAYLQGRAAGKAMAGLDEPFTEAMPVNSIGFFGLHIGTAGAAKGESSVIKTESGYRRFFFAEKRLAGFIIVGDVNRAGIYTALVRSKLPIDAIDFDLVAKKPQLAAFAPKERRKMLNGETV
ncbi:MAG: FAD-dependent oxidoreductase [Oscillospiraceae bacterium]|jgi:NADPH-dependent 2,4-dienoyl-CoA reductase/sulfur reductase-like enzyme|nr:FAD-dependent oxidoreductase [Oscillospiraceae bacterium]